MATIHEDHDASNGLHNRGNLSTPLIRSGNANKGFASMSPERQRQIASAGGKAAHAKGNAHEFTSEEARVAGSKGGKAAHAKGTAHQFTSEEARLAGSKGGRAAHAKNNEEHFLGEDMLSAEQSG